MNKKKVKIMSLFGMLTLSRIKSYIYWLACSDVYYSFDDVSLLHDPKKFCWSDDIIIEKWQIELLQANQKKMHEWLIWKRGPEKVINGHLWDVYDEVMEERGG